MKKACKECGVILYRPSSMSHKVFAKKLFCSKKCKDINMRLPETFLEDRKKRRCQAVKKYQPLFAPGDVGQLKTGGPWMTVSAVADSEVLCTWFEVDRDGAIGQLQTAKFSALSLNKGKVLLKGEKPIEVAIK